MICQGFIQEQNHRKACWLPADQRYPFQLCRRCYFVKITEMVDTLTHEYELGILHPKHELYLTYPQFQEELLHPAREQAFLQLLSTLYNKNRIQYLNLKNKYEDKNTFWILMKKRIEMHAPGVRCKMYREFLNARCRTMQWSCWHCICWSLRQNKKELIDHYVGNFVRAVLGVKESTVLQYGHGLFADCLNQLYLHKYEDILRLVIHHFFLTLELETVKRILSFFLQQPPGLSIVFEKKEKEYFPEALCHSSIVQEWKMEVKRSIKTRTNQYKEELMEKTWHPDRLFTWCFDIQELKDFD